MYSNFKAVITVVVAVALCVAGPALATDFTWDGNGPLGNPSDPYLWSNQFHWTADSGYPAESGSTDTATITDVTPGDTCTFDLTGGKTVADIVLRGVSPTHMTLHVNGGTLTTGTLTWGDYGEFDVDQNFTANSTVELERNLFVDVANGVSFDLDEAWVTETLASVDAETNSSGDFTIDTLHVDVTGTYGGDDRTFFFNGGKLTIDTIAYVIGSPNTNTYKARLWHADGEIDAASVVMDGGGGSTMRAELDIDDVFSADDVTIEQGYAIIDVAAELTAYGGLVRCEPFSTTVKTGSGTFKSGTGS